MDQSPVGNTLYNEYDPLAWFYRRWSAADPVSDPNHSFYHDLSSGVDKVVELGIGDGRIAIGVAETGTRVIGVDSSSEMLEECQRAAREARVEDRITLVQEDFRSFEVSPVELVTMPFRTIGHLLSAEHRLAAFRSVRRHLREGGRFVFDHYVLDRRWAEKHNGVPIPMCSWENGEFRYSVTDVYRYDFERGLMYCSIVVDTFDQDGGLLATVRHPLRFSWLDPNEVPRLAACAGLEIEATYGDYDGSRFDDNASEQIWILKAR